jgi:hypothetical protein
VNRCSPQLAGTRIAFRLLSAILLFSVAASSQVPAPGPAKSSQEVQDKRSDARAEADVPQPTAPAVGKGGSKPTDQSNQPATDDRIVWLTGALVIVGAIQIFVYWKQAAYMRDGLVETRKAADAAKVSADAVVGIERAWLVMHTKEGPQSILEAEFWFANYGRTPAWIIEINCSYRKFNTAIIEALPIGRRPVSSANGWIVPAGKESRPIFTKLETTGLLTETEVAAVHNGSLLLILTAMVKYRDIFGLERETCFCQRFSPTLGWCLHSPESFNRRT